MAVRQQGSTGGKIWPEHEKFLIYEDIDNFKSAK